MPKTILIADDNEAVRTILRLSLQFKGYKLIEVDDGAQALAVLKDTPVDLLISDIAMPNMTGLELLDKLRADAGGGAHKQLPIIICSAESDAKRDNIIARGATDFVAKPYRPLEMLEVIAKIFRQG
ncbi:MAG: response regulator [bacterium]|nr:response regulator [Candidatus Sumerlaeota bacterium]